MARDTLVNLLGVAIILGIIATTVAGVVHLF
ncbi:hypothetical protein BH24ACT16_BH24ACT16_01870 [soil metagenome]